jgi:hypothetical protein
MRNRNDSIAEKQFWGFVQSVIQNPESFLHGRIAGMLNINQVFGTTNRVKILDAIQNKFADKVVELERSQQLTLDQDTLLANIDRREEMTQNALVGTDFEALYHALEAAKVQPYEENTPGKPQDEKEGLKILIQGLRRMGIDARRDIFQNAPVGITDPERMVLLLQFVANHQEFITNQHCPLEFKRTLYTWLQDKHSAQAEQLAQGSQAEAGTPAQRRYILRNAFVVKQSAHEAIASLNNVDQALRAQDPLEINNKLQKISTFLSSFEQFFGEDGASGALSSMIENMPTDEKDLVSGMKDFKGLYSQLKVIIKSLQDQREKYVTEVLKNLPPEETLLERERARAQQIADRMNEMLGAGGGGVHFTRDDFAALERARADIFARVKVWDDARQDLMNRHFNLPGTEAGFAGMLDIGRGIEDALNAIPAEGGDQGEVAQGNGFNGLMRQFMLKDLQNKREEEFNQALNANMKHQMDTLLDRDKDGVIQKTPESGMVLDRLEVADVTHTDGELTFPDSLQHREVFENLTLSRSGLQEKDGKYVSADMVFHNDTHIIQVREANGQVIAESWKKPEAVHGNRNAVVRVPHTQPEAQFVVLNLSTAGTKAVTFANAGRRAA